MLALFKRKSNLPSKKTPSLSEREKKRLNFDLHFLSDEGNKTSIVVSDRSSILIDGKTVYNSEEQIIEVAIGKNTILVATDHPEFHRPHPYSMPLTKQNGNVFALDMSGNLLWRIEDIVELFPDPFRGVWIIADKDREETERLYMVNLIDRHDYCVCSNFWGQNHLIDMTEKKLVVLRGFK